MKVWRDTLPSDAEVVRGIAEVADDRVDGYRWDADTSAVAEGVSEDLVEGNRHGDIAIAGGVAEQPVEGDRQTECAAGSGAVEETVQADRQGQAPAGCDVAEEIVDGDRQAECAAGGGVAEQTVQADRQGERAAGGKVVEDCADVDREVQGARVYQGWGRRQIPAAERRHLVGNGVAQLLKGVDLAGGRAVGGVGEQPELRGNQSAGANGFRVAVEEGVQDRGGPVFEVGERRGVVAAAQRRFDVVRDGR